MIAYGWLIGALIAFFVFVFDEHWGDTSWLKRLWQSAALALAWPVILLVTLLGP